MDRATVEIYDERGLEWAATHARASRRPRPRPSPGGWPGGLRLDVGCGAGRYLPHLGRPGRGLRRLGRHARRVPEQVPDALYVQGDVEHLPFARRSIGRGLVVDDPPARPPAPAAAGPVGPPPGAGRRGPFELQVLDGSTRATTSPGTTSAGGSSPVGSRTGWSTWSPGRGSRSSGLAGGVRGRAPTPGGTGSHPGRHRGAGHAPAGLRGQSLVVSRPMPGWATPARGTDSGPRPWRPDGDGGTGTRWPRW